MAVLNENVCAMFAHSDKITASSNNKDIYEAITSNKYVRQAP